MSAKKIKTPESGVLRACLDLLAAERVWHRRINTGAVMSGNRFLRFMKKGDADILASVKIWTDSEQTGAPVALRVAHFLWIECKSDTGRQSEDQINFECEVRAQGHRYLVVRDAADLRQWLKDNAS